MTDFSGISNEFKMSPGIRPIAGDWKKTVMVVRGAGNTGKSTLCQKLLHPDISYISTDAVFINPHLRIPEVVEHLEQYKDRARFNMHILYPRLAENNPTAAADFLFFNYIAKNPYFNIFLEGWALSFSAIFDEFISRCKVADIRVWNIERII